MKKGLIVAALLGLVVFAGCFHDKETPATDTSSGSSTTAPSTDSTAQ